MRAACQSPTTRYFRRPASSFHNYLPLSSCTPPAPFLLQRLRQRQMRNFAVALLVAHGVPMIHMGDEYGHSKHGNNNTYCHDRWGGGGEEVPWEEVLGAQHG